MVKLSLGSLMQRMNIRKSVADAGTAPATVTDTRTVEEILTAIKDTAEYKKHLPAFTAILEEKSEFANLSEKYTNSIKHTSHLAAFDEYVNLMAEFVTVPMKLYATIHTAKDAEDIEHVRVLDMPCEEYFNISAELWEDRDNGAWAAQKLLDSLSELRNGAFECGAAADGPGLEKNLIKIIEWYEKNGVKLVYAADRAVDLYIQKQRPMSENGTKIEADFQYLSEQLDVFNEFVAGNCPGPSAKMFEIVAGKRQLMGQLRDLLDSSDPNELRWGHPDMLPLAYPADESVVDALSLYKPIIRTRDLDFNEFFGLPRIYN